MGCGQGRGQESCPHKTTVPTSLWSWLLPWGLGALSPWFCVYEFDPQNLRPRRFSPASDSPRTPWESPMHVTTGPHPHLSLTPAYRGGSSGLARMGVRIPTLLCPAPPEL